MSRLSHSEIHMVHRIGWLRAAVLGANDGLVSTASLVVGVAAAGSGKPEVMIAGLAGLMAGAMSMAAEPRTKTCRWRPLTSLPMASAAISLSRIARIMRPQGERSAFSDR